MGWLLACPPLRSAILHLASTPPLPHPLHTWPAGWLPRRPPLLSANLLQWNVSLHALTDSDASEEELELQKEAQFFWDENHPWDRTGHRCGSSGV